MKKYQNLTQDELNNEFIDACINSNLGLIKYLLTSPELKEHADIHGCDGEGFMMACRYGHLEVVKYLLTSPELKEHADIHADNNSAFRWACERGHLEIVKYLLTSSELKEHANIHGNNDHGFRVACYCGKLDIIKFLIFDMDIEKTDAIKKCFKNGKFQEVANLFKIRKLNKSIKNELNYSNNNKKIM